MNESQWLSSVDPAALLRFATHADHNNAWHHQKPSDRKLRLFACACQLACHCGRGIFDKGQIITAEKWVLLGDTGGCPCTVAFRAALLRCVVGNPWRPVTLVWREGTPYTHTGPLDYLKTPPGCTLVLGGEAYNVCRWLTPTVVHLAQTIYDERRWDALPILCDALEEAGCDNADLLAALRGPGPWCRGFWAMDCILGKS